MGADEFRDYILGFIFYKYLSERMQLFADEILQYDGVKFDEIDESTMAGKQNWLPIKKNPSVDWATSRNLPSCFTSWRKRGLSRQTTSFWKI